jgi:phosphatidate phosphatase APP1
MSDWKQYLTKAEIQFQRFRRKYLTHRKPLMIQPYMGYATGARVYLRGRVLEDEGITPAADNDTIWKNLLNMYRRFETDEVGGAVVQARFGSHEVEAVTGEEGFFTFDFALAEPLPSDQTHHHIPLELMSAPHYKLEEKVTATGDLIVPSNQAEFAVISDLDDTVLKTNVLDRLKMARNTFLRNSHDRLPFPGVAAFYRALQSGVSQVFNPIFYVSSSPWNLYDLIMEFFEVRGIPPGPIFLQDFGITPTQFITADHDEHKLGYIHRLLHDYPNLPFVLIGDSSQRDPEIYRQVVEANPDRIKAIYIRDVTPNRRDDEIEKLMATVTALNVEMLLIPDTLIAAKHAAANGLIDESAIEAIAADMKEND